MNNNEHDYTYDNRASNKDNHYDDDDDHDDKDYE